MDNINAEDVNTRDWCCGPIIRFIRDLYYHNLNVYIRKYSYSVSRTLVGRPALSADRSFGVVFICDNTSYTIFDPQFVCLRDYQSEYDVAAGGGSKMP